MEHIKLSDIWVSATGKEPPQEFVDSIKRYGVLEPITVKPATRYGSPNQWEVVDGRLRLAACRKLGISTIPCCTEPAGKNLCCYSGCSAQEAKGSEYDIQWQDGKFYCAHHALLRGSPVINAGLVMHLISLGKTEEEVGKILGGGKAQVADYKNIFTRLRAPLTRPVNARICAHKGCNDRIQNSVWRCWKHSYGSTHCAVCRQKLETHFTGLDVNEWEKICALCMHKKPCIFDQQCWWSERHGRVMHARSCPRWYNMVVCRDCGVMLDDKLSEGSGICLTCCKVKVTEQVKVDLKDSEENFPGLFNVQGARSGRVSGNKKSPQERGKVLCLETGCKVWIKKPAPKGTAAFGDLFDPKAWFCKSHPHTTIEKFPLLDRDGDPIWVTGSFVVTKVAQMEEEHLTNSLAFIEERAKMRCRATGIPEARWLERATPRYQALLDEAKKRDESLTCPAQCNGGLLKIVLRRGVEECEVKPCTQCRMGKERQVAVEIAEKVKASGEVGKMNMVPLVALIISVLCGAGFQCSSTLVHFILEYLHRQ